MKKEDNYRPRTTLETESSDTCLLHAHLSPSPSTSPAHAPHYFGLQSLSREMILENFTRFVPAIPHIGRRMVRGAEEIASRPRVDKHGPLSGPGLALDGLVLGGVDVVKGGCVWVWGGRDMLLVGEDLVWS
ncbi:hypothetical protein RRG08_042132 [Elysia crispata]|uniref:Uncharacterized protein n=1 Tax=Elysia crispata TaxID=231223 RepID=A0AAE0Z2Z3_9GAST|nr:hypothetical protein RRG08_042132 [Elysia crispata]